MDTWSNPIAGIVFSFYAVFILCISLSGVDASLLLNVTSAGTLPTPISAGTTFFSPDGRLFIAAFTNNVTAFDTASGAVVWVAAVEGLVCPGATSSLSMDSQSSDSWDDSAQPLYTQPETSGAPSSVAVYCGCGPTITAITYQGEVSLVYNSSHPSDVAVAITTLATAAEGSPVIAVIFSGSDTIIGVEAASGTALWTHSVPSAGLASVSLLFLYSGADRPRNASIVCLIVLGIFHVNITGYDALTGVVKGDLSMNRLDVGNGPIFGASVVVWGGAWNAPQSVVVYDFVTQEQWTYYPVFLTELWSATTPGGNAFVVGSYNQLILLNATSRQVQWTYVDGNMFTELTYDAAHATITLWNPQSNMVSLVNATDGTLMVRASYEGSVCGSATGTQATGGMWLRSTHTGTVIGLTCNVTIGLGLSALRGDEVAPVVTVDPFPQLTPQLASSAPSLTSLPALTSCSAGPDCRVVTSVAFVTFSDVVTMVYRLTIDNGSPPHSSTAVPPTPAATVPMPTSGPIAPPPSTPTPVTSVAPVATDEPTTQAPTPAPHASASPSSFPLVHSFVGGCVGAALIALILGGFLIQSRRHLSQLRGRLASQHQHRVASMEVGNSAPLHDDLLAAVHTAADTLQ